MKTVAQQLSALLSLIGLKNGVPNPDAKSNIGTMLFNIFVWQEVQKFAKSQLEQAWKEAQSPDGVVASDDVLRRTVTGEAVLSSSPSFALTVKTDTPRRNFDKDHFAAAVAKRYKIRESEILAMVELSMLGGKPPLTKRVIERTKD